MIVVVNNRPWPGLLRPSLLLFVANLHLLMLAPLSWPPFWKAVQSVARKRRHDGQTHGHDARLCEQSRIGVFVLGVVAFTLLQTFVRNSCRTWNHARLTNWCTKKNVFRRWPCYTSRSTVFGPRAHPFLLGCLTILSNCEGARWASNKSSCGIWATRPAVFVSEANRRTPDVGRGRTG